MLIGLDPTRPIRKQWRQIINETTQGGANIISREPKLAREMRPIG